MPSGNGIKLTPLISTHISYKIASLLGTHKTEVVEPTRKPLQIKVLG
nr:MAG TPA: hypothetical protein [Caudoviricetes sp.]